MRRVRSEWEAAVGVGDVVHTVCIFCTHGACHDAGWDGVWLFFFFFVTTRTFLLRD